ncbi:MAG: PIN domain-containing protein [Paenibacillaceae bacterium]
MVTSNLLSDSKIIALDTNLFIYVFEQHPEFGEKAKMVLEHIEEGLVTGVASSVSLTEILVKPIREGNLTLEKQYKLLFSHFPNLTILPVDNVVAERAAYLRGKYNIKTPDALILAAALVANADLFITNDQRLETVREIKCVTLDQL